MDLEGLFANVAHALQAELAAFERLEGGSSANVWRLDLREDDAVRPVVFRQHRARGLKEHDAGIAGKEYRLLGRLYEMGFPVARPLYLDEANRLLVTEFIDGDVAVAPENVGTAIEHMADLLVRIHSLDVRLVDDAGLMPLEDPLERLVTCLPATPHSERLGSLLSTGDVMVHANPSVLIHGDYWPGNILWANDTIAALIDWEDACLGDPLADLACARVELLCQHGSAAMDDFTIRYLDHSGHLDTRSLCIWECYVSATALESMHLWGLDSEEESRRRALTQSFFNEAVDSSGQHNATFRRRT